jgi:hypothetical protein
VTIIQLSSSQMWEPNTPLVYGYNVGRLTVVGASNTTPITVTVSSLLSFVIVGASNTSNIEITTQQPHGLATGYTVVITGVFGNTAANGTFVITVTGPTTFILPGSVGSGDYAGGGVANPVPTAGFAERDTVFVNGVMGNLAANSANQSMTDTHWPPGTGVVYFTMANITSTTFDLWVAQNDGSILPQAGNGAFVAGPYAAVACGPINRVRALALVTTRSLTTLPLGTPPNPGAGIYEVP